MTTDLAQKLKKTLKEPLYEDLVKWLTLQVESLRDINNVRHCAKAQDQALEFKAQFKAYERIMGILNEIIGVKELPEPEAKSDPKEYGLEKSDVEK